MARDEYERLSMARRQATLLQAAVVDNDDVLATGLTELTPRFSDSSPAYRAADIADVSDTSDAAEGEGTVVGEGSVGASTSGCSYEDGRIVVREPGATLRLSFEGLPNSETYLSFRNLHYTARRMSRAVIRPCLSSCRRCIRDRLSINPTLLSIR